MRRTILPLMSLGILIAGSGVGCAAALPEADLSEFDRAYRNQISAVEYEVDPPDVLSIRAPGRPELDAELQGVRGTGPGVQVNLGTNIGATYRVRPDGKIMLYRIGEVYVAGMTPSEISDELTRRYREFYRDVNVVVDVAQYNSKFIQVIGQVGRQGRIPYTGRESLIQVLADVGLLETAWGEKVQIVRGSPEEGKTKVLTINVWDMIENGRVKHNVLLAEGDTIHVPPHPLARVAAGVRLLVSPLVPILGPAGSAAGFFGLPGGGAFGGGVGVNPATTQGFTNPTPGR